VTRVVQSTLCLAGAVLAGAAAVASPLDRLADASFAWHMLQHLVLFYVVALLLVLARPFDLYARLAGKRATASAVLALRPLHTLALPPVGLTVFVATLWVTHFSPLYELSLEHSWVHLGEHFLYVVAGAIFWLPVIAPPPIRPLAYPARLLYLALALPQGALLGMVIGSARTPLYRHYTAIAGFAPALADQKNAAAVMWILGGLVIFAALLLTLAVWARRESDITLSATRRRRIPKSLRRSLGRAEASGLRRFPETTTRRADW
jgi:cytochrome c oxidase assembly factor CtaG